VASFLAKSRRQTGWAEPANGPQKFHDSITISSLSFTRYRDTKKSHDSSPTKIWAFEATAIVPKARAKVIKIWSGGTLRPRLASRTIINVHNMRSDTDQCLVVCIACRQPASQCSHVSSCPDRHAACRQWLQHTGQHPVPQQATINIYV